MAPPAPRFQVELRANGRLIESLGCGPDLTIGEGGALVVPGLGGEVPLLRGGRLVAHDGLLSAVDGTRVSLRVAAHPDLEITVAPLEALVIERSRWTPIPTRETIIAGVLAGCLAALFGRTALRGELTEPERRVEREDTALTLAVYATPAVPPTFVAPRIVRYAEPEPETIADPIDPVPVATVTAAEPVPPLAQPVAKAKPRRRARAKVLESKAFASVLSTELEPTRSVRLSNMLGSTHELVALDASVTDEIHGSADIGIAAAPTEVAIAPSDGIPGGVGVMVAPAKPKAHAEPAPTEDHAATIAVPAGPAPDPRGGKFELDDAFAGHPSLASGQPGTLTAILHTSKGEIRCALFEDRVPRTVANFVGLALGTRESLDPARNEWSAKPFYVESSFHRVVRGFVIQGGDPTGTGSGGPGYEIADEIQADLGHDAAGVLSMANKGPNTGGSQFFVTLDAAPHIDGTSTVFGKCDVEVVARIGAVDVDNPRQRPREAVTIRSVEIVRKAPPAEPAPRAEAVVDAVVEPVAETTAIALDPE